MVSDIIKTKAFTKLLINASLSPLLFDKKAMYNSIKLYK